MTEKEELEIKIKEKIKKYQKLLEELNPQQEIEVENALQLEERVDKKPKVPKLLTGVDWLDLETGGIKQGTFINLAGQSFAGKSQLALKIISNISEYKKTVLFSFEMYEDKLVDRLRSLSKTQKENIEVIQKSFKLEQVEAHIRRNAKQGVHFFVIDSRMKIVAGIDGKEYQQISYLSNQLSKLCQELGIIIILINQISEEDLKHGRLSLKGSGDQYYDSDMILFLYIQKEKDGTEKRICCCEKDRDGERKWRRDITEVKPQVIEYQENISMSKI